MNTIKWGLAALILMSAHTAAAQSVPSPTQQTAIVIDPQSFDRYVGYYQVGPRLAVRLWREDNHYYFGTVGTPQRMEIFAASPTRFFLKNVPVTFTFSPGPDGSVNGMTVNQAGRDIQALRIDDAKAKTLSVSGAAHGHPMPRTWAVLNLTSRALTSQQDGSMDYWPCFSPDGKTVLFSRTLDGGKTWSLFRVPTSGGPTQRFISPSGSATRASWSANINRITFDLDGQNGSHAIWVVDGDGTGAHVVTTAGSILPGYPSWDATGKNIVFTDFAKNILLRVPVDGGEAVTITDQKQVLAGMASVSPDGKWIAFAGQKNSGQAYNQEENQIWLVDDSGTTRTLETAPLPGRTPSWSPNGKRIAFESDRGSPDGHYAAFIINRDGTELMQVTDYALNASHPVFSPDGRELVFAMGNPERGQSNIGIVDLP
ncbi:MAG TPA: hypothetical protein VHV26_01170 [Rhizomicrobium sp.]|jgi:Tol biopolymer transport system component|nr:hypothetical protein [Rhizomicrobium sp.]